MRPALAAILVFASFYAVAQVDAGIHIAQVRFTGDTQLKDVDLDNCASDVKTGGFSGPRWEAQVDGVVKSICLQNHGYFRARVTSTAKQLPDKDQTHQFLVTINIDPGPQYRFAEVKFAGNHVIPSSDLAALFPLHRGDVFKLSQIIEGVTLIRQAYKARGYPNFVPIPDFRFDEQKKLITVTINIDEGNHVD